MADPLTFSPAELVEELRDKARSESEFMRDGMPAAAAKIGIPVIQAEGTVEWEAADLIEAMHGALRRIYDGAPDPKAEAAPFVED